MSDRLSEIEGRLAAATPGPWLKDSDEPYIVMKPDSPGSDWDGREVARVLRDDYGLFEEADTDLIAHAPTDLAALIDAVKAVRALHHPKSQETSCQECRGDWPCFTAAIVAAALDES